ncbi:MAG: TIGR04290 family methyltransferase [Woeseia sp.]
MNETDSIAAELAQFGEWFHNLHLPGGIETAPGHPLGDFPARKWQRVHHCIPSDLSGWRVLDVGCNAGFYSFALAARGAKVTGVDVDPRYLAQARWAGRYIDVDTPPDFQQLSVYRLRELQGPFDLIWFMGVAYHLRHPLLALDIVRSLSPRFLMFQTMTFPDIAIKDVPEDFALTERSRIAAPGWPKLAFIERRLAGDPTNWWAANDTCAQAMLRSSGFRVLECPEHETYWCQRADVGDEVVRELDVILQGQLH